MLTAEWARKKALYDLGVENEKLLEFIESSIIEKVNENKFEVKILNKPIPYILIDTLTSRGFKVTDSSSTMVGNLYTISW
jgi:hypothetical protein